jgi:hypothetical protein
MKSLNFSLGPFEIFAAIMGGLPLFFACFLLYHPTGSLQDLVPIVRQNASVAIAVVILSFSYVLGGVAQSPSWRYFLLLCKLFRQDFNYFGHNPIQESNKRLLQAGMPLSLEALSFEDKLVVLLHKELDIQQETGWMAGRLKAYLREREKQSVLNDSERYLATHIMYRTWSLGFFAMSAVLVFNLFRVSPLTFELWLLPWGAIAFAFLTFYNAVKFKRWHSRELLLGFYFAATNSTSFSSPATTKMPTAHPDQSLTSEV